MTPRLDIAIGVSPGGDMCVIVRVVGPPGSATTYLTASAAIKAGAALSRAGAELLRGLVRGVVADA